MYAGRIVERAPADALFDTPLHPYTLGLIATLPDPDPRRRAAGDPGRRAGPGRPSPAAASPIAARGRRRLPRRRTAAGTARGRAFRRLLQGRAMTP
jgi:ABC-type dipeptide/oligopeptide/nickel transport system ATPase component